MSHEASRGGAELSLERIKSLLHLISTEVRSKDGEGP